jgi:hypothetical protein
VVALFIDQRTRGSALGLLGIFGDDGDIGVARIVIDRHRHRRRLREGERLAPVEPRLVVVIDGGDFVRIGREQMEVVALEGAAGLAALRCPLAPAEDHRGEFAHPIASLDRYEQVPRAVERSDEIGVGVQQLRDRDRHLGGDDDLLPAAVERDPCFEHREFGAASVGRMLDHLQSADRAGAVERRVEQLALGHVIDLLVLEIAREQQLAVEIGVPARLVEAAGYAGVTIAIHINPRCV